MSKSRTIAPPHLRAFPGLLIAELVGSIGTWMQTVGAQWFLVREPNAALLVALVQVVDTFPDVAFGWLGGVLADTFDRRRLLIVLNLFLTVVGAALTLLTAIDAMSPALLLTFTFLLGTASVVSLPAYQSLVNDIVPRIELPAAAALSSMNINVARAVGPAIAGLLIARTGVVGVFALNTLAFLFYVVVMLVWRPQLPPRQGRPEPFVSAVIAGERYVRHSVEVRRILVRTALFVIPYSALIALLPVAATHRLGMSADGYGLLLAAVGIGDHWRAPPAPYQRMAVAQPARGDCESGTRRRHDRRRDDPAGLAGCRSLGPRRRRVYRCHRQHQRVSSNVPSVMGSWAGTLRLSDGPLRLAGVRLARVRSDR